MDKTLYEYADWSVVENVIFTNNMEEAEILAIGLSNIIDEKVLKKCPRLKFIVSPTTGLDHIKDRSVPVVHLIPDEIKHITAASEFAFLLMLCLLRKSWAWDCSTRENLQGEDLSGKTVGIIGYGRVGKHIDKCVTAFGARVVYYDKIFGGELCEVLRNSDIIMVCVSATNDNIKFIDEGKFDMMEKNPYFINMSRGFVVDDSALLSALKSGKVCAAALDVVENRSIYDDYEGENLIFTPHIAGNTVQSKRKACGYVLKKLSELTKKHDI